MKTFTAYVEWDPESKLYMGLMPGIQGAHTQAATLDELQENLKEVLELCLEQMAIPRVFRASLVFNKLRSLYDASPHCRFSISTKKGSDQIA